MEMIMSQDALIRKINFAELQKQLNDSDKTDWFNFPNEETFSYSVTDPRQPFNYGNLINPLPQGGKAIVEESLKLFKISDQYNVAFSFARV